MVKRKLWLIAALALLMIGSSAPAQALKLAADCPVMPGHAVKEKHFVDYHGKRVYFCCRSCVKAFNKHPEKYIQNLPEHYFS